MQDFDEIVSENRHDLALVLGNGINRYRSPDTAQSWDDLIAELAGECLDAPPNVGTNSIDLTEYYDLLDLLPKSNGETLSLQHRFLRLLDNWKPKAHHERIMSWAKLNRCPVLTTNFDTLLSDSVGCELFHMNSTKFTDYYPWETYHGDGSLVDPASGFGVWHINGMKNYPRSVRLGLSHYMGSVHRARAWFHRGKGSLFSAPDATWQGMSSWLQVFLSKPLLIIGLGLERNEVFLRWLLIERARYFQKFRSKRKAAWYVYTEDPAKSGKLMFLEGVGVKPIRTSTRDEIYGCRAWS